MVDSAIANTVLHHKAHDLLALIEALNHSGSRLEDQFWETQLTESVQELLIDPDSTLLEQLLDYLANSNQFDIYDVLVSLIEGLAESTTIHHKGQPYDVLLVTAPITAWTRYQLPDGVLGHELHENLLSLFKNYAGPDAKVAVLGQLLSFDQLPKSFALTHKFTAQLGRLALEAQATTIELDHQEDGITLLADTKFIVCAIATPSQKAAFGWQQSTNPLLAKQHSQTLWQEQCAQLLAPLFTGCQTEFLAPDGFYHNTRLSDRLMRPLAIKAAVHWLASITQSEFAEISAVIARCGQNDTEEFRIGFAIENNPDILYGCVWPIFSKDEIDRSSSHYENSALLIQNILTDLGIESILFLGGLYDPEFCDDCSAPAFPTADGELQHPYLPDELDFAPESLH